MQLIFGLALMVLSIAVYIYLSVKERRKRTEEAERRREERDERLRSEQARRELESKVYSVSNSSSTRIASITPICLPTASSAYIEAFIEAVKWGTDEVEGSTRLIYNPVYGHVLEIECHFRDGTTWQWRPGESLNPITEEVDRVAKRIILSLLHRHWPEYAEATAWRRNEWVESLGQAS